MSLGDCLNFESKRNNGC